jgi:hypothetical protein
MYLSNFSSFDSYFSRSALRSSFGFFFAFGSSSDRSTKNGFALAASSSMRVCTSSRSFVSSSTLRYRYLLRSKNAFCASTL